MDSIRIAQVNIYIAEVVYFPAYDKIFISMFYLTEMQKNKELYSVRRIVVMLQSNVKNRGSPNGTKEFVLGGNFKFLN